jgi:hypothetical protein
LCGIDANGENSADGADLDDDLVIVGDAGRQNE